MSLDTRTKPTPAWLVREADVPGYHPANHTGTLNRRLIGPDTVGSRHVEVLLGVIEAGQGALPHAHPGIEQVCATCCPAPRGRRWRTNGPTWRRATAAISRRTCRTSSP